MMIQHHFAILACACKPTHHVATGDTPIDRMADLADHVLTEADIAPHMREAAEAVKAWAASQQE